MNYQSKVPALAAAFCEMLLAEIGAQSVAVANSRNYINGRPRADGICASHDFCDANMCMSDAWEQVIGHALDITSDEQARAWTDAWALAIECEFNAQACADPLNR